MLKYIRITLAAVVFLLSLLFFLDFASLLPLQLHGVFHLQFIPAVLSRSWGIVVVLLLLVVVFGRVYCSVLCPLGILQDIIGRCKKLYVRIRHRKGKKPKKVYRKPYNVTRYGIFAIVVIPLFFGSTVMLTATDPYSNFGRIVMGIFRPVYVWLNNLAAGVMNYFGNYSMYSVPQQIYVGLLIAGGVVLVALVVMVLMRGRLWCNTVCPVGALFSFISRYSIFRIAISESKCVHCNKCVAVCKSECIDHKNLRVDNSRCVACFNCTAVCDKDAIAYKLKYCKEQKVSTHENEKPADESRRRFIVSAAGALALVPLAGAAAAVGVDLAKVRRYPLPPGAVPDFRNRCTGCQLCVSKCPMHLLRPAYFERGVAGIMQPYMYFQPNSYCSWECTICCSVCPNGALQRLSVEEKKVRQVGVVEFVMPECVVYKDNVDCGACAEHCPTQAVRMVPYKDGLTIPQIDQTICIGCGACESICPMRPDAIFVVARDPQGVADTPEDAEQEDVEVSGFGF